MKNNEKTKQQLIIEIEELHSRINELENTEKYLDLYDNAPDMFFSVKPDGTVISVNKYGADYLGYSKDELLGSSVWNVVYPEDLSFVQAKILEIIDNKIERSELDFRKVRKDGSVIYVHERTQLIFNEDNEISEIRIICRDITERKVIGDTLKIEEEKYRSLTNNLNVGIYRSTTDIKGRFIEVNPSFLKMFGFKNKGELFSLNVSDLYLNPEDRKSFYKRIQEKGFAKNQEFKLKKKDGKVFIGEISTVIIKDNAGKAIYYDGIVEDITDRKLIESKIKTQNAFLNNVLESLTHPFYVINVDDYSIEIANTAAKKFVSEGHSTCYALTHQNSIPCSRAGEVCPIDEIKKTKRPCLIEHIHKDKKGNDKIFEVNAFPIISEDGDLKQIIEYTIDISERKKAELEIREKEEQYRTLFNMAPGGILLEDDKGTIMDANSAYCKILGYEYDELIGNNVRILCHSDNLPDVEKNIKKILKGELFKHTEKSIRKDGSHAYLELQETRITLPNGKPGVICIVNDITEQKKAQEDLRNSEESYKGLFDNATDAIYIQDKQGKFVDVNKGAIKMYGYPRKYFIGKSPEFLSAPGKNDLHEIGLKIKKAFEGKPQRFEFWGIDKKGREFPKEVRLNKGIYFGKEVVIAFAQDITERKKTEREIRKLSRSVEQSPTIVVITDLNAKIEYVNPKFCEVTGYSYDEIIGKNPRILNSGETPVETYTALWETITAGKEWFGEFKNKTKNGGVYWESAHIFPLKNEKNVITNYIALKEDITERKKLEHDLILSKEKAEESDKLKSAFLANMSHEIRTPMNSIIGFSQLLTEKDILPEEQDHYVELIQKSGEDLLNLIDDIIDISKIEAGQIKVFRSQYFLDNILGELYDSYLEFVKTKKDTSQFRIKYKRPRGAEKVVINTDIDRFKQIIRNLISNAIKFTDFGLVEFGFKTVVNKTDSNILFYVRDTGIGIPTGKLKIIFESFRQANESNTKLYGGTGLGLAITKKMVEILGGRIWVESTPDQGSTFYFTLPYYPIVLPTISTKKTITNKDTKSYNWENKRILIVEDDDQSFIFFEKVLKRTLAKIVRTNNGKDAIELCNQSNFDLVLMDIQLPGMDGYKTTEKIKKIHPDLPVIAQTAYALAGEKKRSITAGCDDYISKPVNIQKLLELVDKHI